MSAETCALLLWGMQRRQDNQISSQLLQGGLLRTPPARKGKGRFGYGRVYIDIYIHIPATVPLGMKGVSELFLFLSLGLCLCLWFCFWFLFSIWCGPGLWSGPGCGVGLGIGPSWWEEALLFRADTPQYGSPLAHSWTLRTPFFILLL